MRLSYSDGQIEIGAVSEAWGTDYYVYGVYAGGDPRICPSLGMAYEIGALNGEQMTTNFQTEFPDYPVADMPAMPTHGDFIDTSWHNDACPRLASTSGLILLTSPFASSKIATGSLSCGRSTGPKLAIRSLKPTTGTKSLV